MRRGYTLTELLVVMIILLILVAATLPVAKRIMADNRTREASRILHAAFAKARTQAVVTGRPHGVWLDTVPPIGMPYPAGFTSTTPLVRQSTTVYAAEVAAPFSGGILNSYGICRVEAGIPKLVPLVPVTYIDNNPRDGYWDDDLNRDGIPDPSDADNDSRVDINTAEQAFILSNLTSGEPFIARFDNKGPWFNFQNHPTNGLVFLGTNTAGLPVAPVKYDDARVMGFAFQIVRRPRRMGSPTELPTGTVIDLPYSGLGQGGRQFNYAPGAGESICIMFRPDGVVAKLYGDGVEFDVGQTIHLLIGRPEKIADPLGANSSHPSGLNMFDIATSNLADPNSLWVSVGANGSITSSENTPDTDHASHPTPWTTAGQLEYVAECRSVAAQHEQMGGN